MCVNEKHWWSNKYQITIWVPISMEEMHVSCADGHIYVPVLLLWFQRVRNDKLVYIDYELPICHKPKVIQNPYFVDIFSVKSIFN